MTKGQINSHYPQVASQPLNPVVVEWLGEGVYYQRIDNRWVHQNSDAGAWKAITALNSLGDIVLRIGSVPVINAEWAIQTTLLRLGLPAQNFYYEITLDRCEALQSEAERWRIPYSWGEKVEFRFLFRDRHFLTFCWSYGK